jgi:DNA-binding HxlR family transcriptional regulator
VTEEPRSGCPLNATVEVLGDRWSIIVLRDIMYSGHRHFRTLQRENLEGIASNILADRLRKLVAAGLLTRDDAGAGQRATYSLTEAAIELVPVFAHLSWWGVRHRKTSAVLRARAEVQYEGGPEVWQKFMDELRKTHLGADAVT